MEFIFTGDSYSENIFFAISSILFKMTPFNFLEMLPFQAYFQQLHTILVNVTIIRQFVYYKQDCIKIILFT